MFKRRRKSDPKTLPKDVADGTGRCDFLEPESDVLRDLESPCIPKIEGKRKKKDETEPRTLTKTKKTTPMRDGNNFEKQGTTKENLVRNDTKFESFRRGEETGAKSLPVDSWVETNSDQEEMKEYDAVRINEEDRRDRSKKWSRGRNQWSANSHFEDDDTDVKDQSVQSENFNSSGLVLPEARNSDSTEYQDFLRNVDRASGSTVIQSEDSYEKLRYSGPRIKRVKEATVGPELWKAKRSLFHRSKELGKQSGTRDMETRNSNDIIISSNLKNRRLVMPVGNLLLGKKRVDDHVQLPEDRKGPLHKHNDQVRSTAKSNEPSGFNSTEKTPRRKLMDGPYSASSYSFDDTIPKKMLTHRDAGVQTNAPSSSATRIATCCSMEEIRSLEKSLLRFLSESRLARTPRKDDDQSSATREKMPQEKINLHVHVTNAGCEHVIDSRSSVNKFSTKKTESFRKPCRCGNGCGTEDKTTCCCRRN